MKSKGIIKIKSRRKVLKEPVPAKLTRTLRDIFYQNGGIEALANASGLHRNVISQIKNEGTATPTTIEKVKAGISQLQKQTS